MTNDSKRFSISSIAWTGSLTGHELSRLREVGLSGVEIAPTAIWPNVRNIDLAEVREFGRKLRRHELAVSGIQSLLFGQPDLQLLVPGTWPALRQHLEQMLALGEALGAQVAVFGSPKNRLRGSLDTDRAMERAAEFFLSLIPRLSSVGITLTLEPNAPGYGADFLTTYDDVAALATAIDSPSIRPQIDTGCLEMVDQGLESCLEIEMPAHVHVSAPDLRPPPGNTNHHVFGRTLREYRYQGWKVLEMRPTGETPFETALHCAKWMVSTYSEGDSL